MALAGEAVSRSESVLQANLLGVGVGVDAVINDGPHQKKEPEEHDGQDEVTDKIIAPQLIDSVVLRYLIVHGHIVLPEGHGTYHQQNKLKKHIAIDKCFLVDLAAVEYPLAILSAHVATLFFVDTARNDLIVVLEKILLGALVFVEIFFEPKIFEVVPHDHGDAGADA